VCRCKVRENISLIGQKRASSGIDQLKQGQEGSKELDGTTTHGRQRVKQRRKRPINEREDRGNRQEEKRPRTLICQRQSWELGSNLKEGPSRRKGKKALGLGWSEQTLRLWHEVKKRKCWSPKKNNNHFRVKVKKRTVLPRIHHDRLKRSKLLHATMGKTKKGCGDARVTIKKSPQITGAPVTMKMNEA